MNEIETKFYESIKTKLENCQGSFGRFMYTIKKDEIENVYQFSVCYDKNNFNFILALEYDEVIEGYIPDFIFYHSLLQDYGYVVEIDGFEWHEKTKEQVINDRKKDRCYLKNGYIPIRFLGSEVYHDVECCIEELIKIIIETEFLHYEHNDYKEWENIENFRK